MTAGTLLLCYAIWEHQEDDGVNAVWHQETVAALDPFVVGHYVGESDIIAEPGPCRAVVCACELATPPNASPYL
ncbi:MAG: hypothetical protein R3B95_06520 [Nitrospirales bacterium]|nr:hypothetical protein [Nitrospirales bacterium]